MTRYSYQPVKATGTKSLPCPNCGKKVRRQRTFQQTISPFNKNSDGSIKSPVEVQASVNAATRAWERVPVVCSRCAVEVSAPPKGTP